MPRTLQAKSQTELSKPTPTEIKDPALKRLSELTIELKEQYGSVEKVSDVLGFTGSNVTKWINGDVEKVPNLRVGNLRRLAEIKGWTIDYLMDYLEGTTPAVIGTNKQANEGLNLASLSHEEKLRLILELAISLNQAQEMQDKPNPDEVLNLSKAERLRLSKLLERSIEKVDGLMANVSQDSGLTMPFLEGVANADEDLVIVRSALDLIAPHCFRPFRWDGLRPKRLSEERLKDAEDLLAAIKNGNGVK